MIVTVSAGNSGNVTDDSKYIGCPADADGALTVGATDAGGEIADFSSWGPNSSGRIKPDVVSIGQGTVIADMSGNPTGGNGTSFSNPNLAGLVACLWQAFPEFSNHEILDAVRSSADRYLAPDERYGYGIPDFEKAYKLLQTARGINVISNTGTQWISAFPVPFHDDVVVVYKGQHDGNAYLALTDAIGRTIEKKSIVTLAGQWYSVYFDRAPFLPAGVYFIHYTDGRIQTTLKVIRH
jgi:subtilisin family serine protease